MLSAHTMRRTEKGLCGLTQEGEKRREGEGGREREKEGEKRRERKGERDGGRITTLPYIITIPF